MGNTSLVLLTVIVLSTAALQAFVIVARLVARAEPAIMTGAFAAANCEAHQNGFHAC